MVELEFGVLVFVVYVHNLKKIHFCFWLASQKKKKAKKLSKVVQRGINRMGKAGKMTVL